MKEDAVAQLNKRELRRLRRLVIDLVEKWETHKTLFFDPDNEELLWESGGRFWLFIYDLILDSIILSITRFFDQDKTCGHPNLTLVQAASHIKDTEALDKFHDKLKDLRNKIGPLKDIRNQIISHHAKPERGREFCEPVPPGGLIGEMIDGIIELMVIVDGPGANVDYRSYTTCGVSELLGKLRNTARDTP